MHLNLYHRLLHLCHLCVFRWQFTRSFQCILMYHFEYYIKYDTLANIKWDLKNIKWDGILFHKVGHAVETRCYFRKRQTNYFHVSIIERYLCDALHWAPGHWSVFNIVVYSFFVLSSILFIGLRLVEPSITALSKCCERWMIALISTGTVAWNFSCKYTVVGDCKHMIMAKIGF